jgi:hypothetical protein
MTPKSVIEIDPELGPLDRKIDEILGYGGANTFRKYAAESGTDMDTKFMPSITLGDDLQMIPVSAIQRDGLHTDESSFAAIEKDWRPKYFPPIKCIVEPVAGGVMAAKEENICCTGDK